MDSRLDTQKVIIIKNTVSKSDGIKSQILSRYCIGYVIKGVKYLYSADGSPRIVKAGEIFYMNIGQHYTDNIPDKDKPYEEVLFYYTPEIIGGILTDLRVTFQMSMDMLDNPHKCTECSETHKYIICKGWKSLGHFMTSVNHYIKDNKNNTNILGDQLKITELLYIVLSNDDCCIKGRILSDNDKIKENFKQIINNNIFVDISIDQLACKCNKSLTSFKNEFKRYFNDSPHKWLIKQRLIHSKLLLISSNKPISMIGSECIFPNTSHFIKLFKQAYKYTPANYRTKYKTKEIPHQEEVMQMIQVSI